MCDTRQLQGAVADSDCAHSVDKDLCVHIGICEYGWCHVCDFHRLHIAMRNGKP